MISKVDPEGAQPAKPNNFDGDTPVRVTSSGYADKDKSIYIELI